MSDTPSNTEIDNLLCKHWPAYSMQAVLVKMWLREAIESAIAQWGTPQPVVRHPLTDEQIDALIVAKHFREGYELTASDKVCINWYRLGLRDGERAAAEIGRTMATTA